MPADESVRGSYQEFRTSSKSGLTTKDGDDSHLMALGTAELQEAPRAEGKNISMQGKQPTRAGGDD